MKNIANTAQKQIGFMISIVGIIAVLKNISDGYFDGETIIQSISHIEVWLLLITIIPFINKRLTPVLTPSGFFTLI